jgi:hypothetical protein
MVLAIIGILITELLPAVQSDREAEIGPWAERYHGSRKNLPADGMPVGGSTGVASGSGGASAAYSACYTGNLRTVELTNHANRANESHALTRQDLAVIDVIDSLNAPVTAQVTADTSGQDSRPIVDFSQAEPGSTASIAIRTDLNGNTVDEWGFTVILDEGADTLRIVDGLGDFDASDTAIDGKMISAIEPLSVDVDIPAGDGNELTVTVSAAVREVPEPATAALLTLGGLALVRRKRRPR